MKREVVATKNAPAAVGPYSQAIISGGLVFTAGHVGNDPETGSRFKQATRWSHTRFTSSKGCIPRSWSETGSVA